MSIHPTAVIEEGAEIGSGTSVGPYSVIGARVKIGNNNQIASHVVIEGNTAIGDGNTIFQFASVGSIPQDLKYHGEESRLEIGNNNKIREYVTIQPGTEDGGMVTRIADNNLFMACAHVAHDVQMGSHCIMVNNAGLAGHIVIGDHVIMGGHTGYHQFIRLGDYSFISGGAIVTQDIPPYCVAQGDRAGLAGVNKIGLERNGFSAEDVRTIQNLYREVFLESGTYVNKLENVKDKYSDNEKAMLFVDFLQNTERSIASPRKGQAE